MKVIFVLSFLLATSMQAEGLLLEKLGEIDMSSHLSFYEDKKANLTFEEIQIHQSEFKKKHSYFGLSNSAIWGKFVIEKTNPENDKFYIIVTNPTIGQLDFYIPGQKVYTAGENFPINTRLIKDKKIIIPLELKTFPAIIYFRAISGYTMDLSMKIVSQDILYSDIKKETGIYGIFTGIVLGLILYNFFVYLTIRDTSYLYYVLYGFFNYLTLAGIQSYVAEYLLPGQNKLVVFTNNLTSTLSVIFAMQFGRSFLYANRRHPLIDKALLYSIPVFIINFILGNSNFGEMANLIHLYIYFTLLPLVAILLLYMGIKSYREHIYARYYTHAWMIFLVIIILYSLKTMNLVEIPFLGNYALETGTSIEVILLSFALAYRIRTLQDQALKDPLTGLYNRRAMQDYLEEKTKKNQLAEKDLPLILIDIDNFKKINDQFSHDMGDTVLKEFAKVLNDNLRSLDFISRWGGEEFAIILNDTTAKDAVAIAEKLRNTIETYSFPIGRITASFGVSSYKTPETMRDFFHRTDKALYKAKKDGKNRVVSC